VPASERESERRDAFAPERAGIKAGVVGGIVMIAIAVVWFYLGWQAGFIFFYPPILALIGLVAILKGLLEGNLAGRRRPRDSARGFVPSEDAEVD